MIGRQLPGYWIARAHVKLRNDADPERVAAVSAKLLASPGVEQVDRTNEALSIDYDIRACSHEQIVALPTADGLTAPLTALQRFRYQIIRYREAIRRSEESMEYGWDSWIREVYVSRYKHRDHGRRDDRMKHWRQYMGEDRIDTGGDPV